MAKRTKIVIAHKYPLDIWALSQTIKQAIGEVFIITADSHRELRRLIQLHPDTALVLLDLDIRSSNLSTLLKKFIQDHPQLPILATSDAISSPLMQRLYLCGFSGFISKKDTRESVCEAVKTVLSGTRWFPENISDTKHRCSSPKATVPAFSKQQARVMLEIDKGLMNKQIASKLSISESTTKVHVSAILKKLGVRNRTQAIVAFREVV